MGLGRNLQGLGSRLDRLTDEAKSREVVRRVGRQLSTAPANHFHDTKYKDMNSALLGHAP